MVSFQFDLFIVFNSLTSILSMVSFKSFKCNLSRIFFVPIVAFFKIYLPIIPSDGLQVIILSLVIPSLYVY